MPTILGKGAFDNCKNLEAVKTDGGNIVNIIQCAHRPVALLPPELFTTRDASLRYRQELKYICIPDGIQKIEDWWFTDTIVETVYAPASVIQVGEHAFYGCK